jgi:hypothetical protein
MPRNMAGAYSLPAGSLVTDGVDDILAAQHNDPLQDLASDANNARPVVAGGTGADNAPDALVNLGVTATAAELNVLDGITATVAELNILDGVTATAAELNILDGATLTVTELNYVDGVTSAIQTQLNAKAPTIADPNADRIRFWDDSAGAEAWLTPGTGLAITDTTLAVTSSPGFTYIGSQSVTSDATGIITGLGGYRRVKIVAIGLDQVSSGNLRLRVGDSGGLFSTSIYQYASGALTSFIMSDGTNNPRSFVIVIDSFNTAEVLKSCLIGSDTNNSSTPVGVLSTDDFDRVGVFSDFGANNINAGTLYWWGEV